MKRTGRNTVSKFAARRGVLDGVAVGPSSLLIILRFTPANAPTPVRTLMAKPDTKQLRLMASHKGAFALGILLAFCY
jgi:hypothetical protein